MPPPRQARLSRLALVAALLHLGFDAITRPFPATTPPYLLLRYMADVFREMLGMLGVGAVSAVTSAVNGLVSAIFALALAEVARARWAKLAALLLAVWLLTGGAILAIYVAAPWGIALGSLAAGLPRAAAIAFFLDRMMPRPAPEPGAAGG